MQIPFFKYQGTGNDFIIIDNRGKIFPKEKTKIINLCDRKFGIGSDGLILIEEDDKSDFYMDFYNPDASQSFCGNGSRCAVAFAHRIGIIEERCQFRAIDGEHQASIEGDTVEVSMKEVHEFESDNGSIILDTGSPHYVKFVPSIQALDIIEEGRKIRYSEAFKREGINVNLVELNEKGLKGATYERGVENETLSRGTGVTAMALAANIHAQKNSPIHLETKGGKLEVFFNKVNGHYQDIRLKAAATFVFKGEISIENN